MRLFCFFIIFLFSLNSIVSQDTWEYYAQDFWTQDIQIIGDNVWIGNPTALHILDIETGEGHKLQSVNSQLRGSFIKEILPAGDHVWIALESGGIARFTFGESDEGGTWDQFYAPIDGTQDTVHRARNLMEDKDGTLWFDMGWAGKMLLYSIKDDILIDHSNFSTEEAFLQTCHGNQMIFYRTGNNSLHVFNTETLESTAIPLPLSNLEVYSFTAFHDELYVSFSDDLGNNSIYRYNDTWMKIADTETLYYIENCIKGANRMWYSGKNDEPEFTAISATSVDTFTLEDLAVPGTIEGDATKIINEDETGRIWMSSYSINTPDKQDVHIYSVLNNNVQEYNVNHSNFRNSVSIDEKARFDCDGNLIIVGLTTVQIFHPDSSKIIIVNEDRSNGDLVAVSLDESSCRYYVAQDGGFLGPSYVYMFENNISVDTIVIENNGISSIHKSTNGNLYVGLGQSGVAVYDEENNFINKITVHFQNPESTLLNYIYDIKEFENGEITFGTFASLVILKDGIWSTYDKSNSPIGSESVINPYIDKDGNILVQFQGGVYKYTGLEWEYTAFFNPFVDFISSFHQDISGNYWLGTQNNGLLFWNGFDYLQFDIMSSAMPSNSIRNIIPHPDTGDLWILSNRGIIIYNRDVSNYQNGIFGKTFYDASQNMIYDVGTDTGLEGVAISINDEITVFSDINGNYSFYDEDNSFISIECLPKEEFEFTTSSIIDTFLSNEDLRSLNFGFWNEIEDLDVEMNIEIGPLVCSTEVPIWITIKNPGWNTVNGQAKLILPPEINILSTIPDADELNNNEVSWNFDNLNFNEQRSFYAVVEGPSVEELMEELDSTDTVFIPIKAELSYNGKTIEQTREELFLCSYDPNDKISSSVGSSVENFSLLEDALEFTIRFQNEGNYKATNVIITDTLDYQLDIETFELLGSSHLVNTQLNNISNELIFRFSDIDLPPKSENEAGSQGFVKYRIAAKEGLPINTLILNQAAIYFDSNAPIFTNRTENILVDELPIISSVEENFIHSVYRIAPNPFKNVTTISSNVSIRELSILDINGAIILHSTDLMTKLQDIDLGQFPSGIYFVKVATSDEVKTFKIIKI